MTYPNERNNPSLRTDAHSEFESVAQNSRIIREFSGLLPPTGHAARHILRCEHLRQLPGERFHPFRAEPDYTHQLWFWYRLHLQPEQLILLFRGQFNLDLFPQRSDEAANALTHLIAQELLVMPSERYLFREADSELYWASVVSNAMQALKGEEIIFL